MVRKANKKNKGHNLQERKLIIIATEGNNKTENTYFREFNNRQSEYRIIPAMGNNTDGHKIVTDAVSSAKSKGLDYAQGDLVFAVFDTDFNKEKQIEEAIALGEKNNVNIILSNPCFEVWLLQHFRYSTKAYKSNDQTVKELKGYWPEYNKNIGSFHQIENRLQVAIENAKKLEQYHYDVNGSNDVLYNNSSTSIHHLIQMIMKSKNI